MANNVAIRIDGDFSGEIKAFLDKDGGAYLVVKELEGSNPHYHIVLHSDRKLSAVRTALKRAIPQLNGNGSYSVATVRDLAKYQRYMAKGESQHVMPVVVCAHGMVYTDPDWLEEQHDAYWAENAELTSRKRKAPVQEVVLHRCKEKAISWSNREAIAREYIKELADRGKGINIFATKSQVNLIQIQLCPGEEAIEDLARQI